MNGIFLLDFISALPLHNPMAFANDYYNHFPAITIGFYPPLLSVIMAGFYAIFGVSHQTAQLCIATFIWGLGAGSYILSKQALGKYPALAVAILTISAPIVTEWGSQVMLDIPATCLLTWAIIYFSKWLDTGNHRSIIISLFFFIAGLYTKQTIIFFVLSAITALIFRRQLKLILNYFFIKLSAFTAITLIPLAIMTFFFGRTNLESAAGARSGDLSITSFKSWISYLTYLPDATGWPVFLLGTIGIAATAFNRKKYNHQPIILISLLWFLGGYIFFSSISLRMPRNTIQFVFPICFFSVWTLAELEKHIKYNCLKLTSTILVAFTLFKGVIK